MTDKIEIEGIGVECDECSWGTYTYEGEFRDDPEASYRKFQEKHDEACPECDGAVEVW